ncbi:MAG: thiamine biosynthesis protein ThiS [Verrucomicrobiales bacterium]|jgi:thiamine biosynthesis protein ThiS
MMTLKINGEDHEIQTPAESLTAEQLLAELKLGYPVLVELNGVALFPRELPERDVHDGDSLELMRMTAGG